MGNNIKMQKKLKDDDLFYLVYNQDKNVFHDWFLFEEYQNMPNIEKFFFKLMQEELVDLFSDSDYSSNKYKADLLIMYNICFNGEKIDYRSSNILSDLYIQIRFNDLSDSINIFQKKSGINNIENYKNEFLKLTIDVLSDESKKMYDEVKLKCAPNCKSETFFKEIIYLCIFNEYKKALTRAIKEAKLVKKVDEILNKHNVK